MDHRPRNHRRQHLHFPPPSHLQTPSNPKPQLLKPPPFYSLRLLPFPFTLPRRQAPQLL
ncbi:hypothetical protein KSS87_021373 [Heliosperma pusillum]|nr:hypothetical protein KSS87_021373 [Heliosperma pusillum]